MRPLHLELFCGAGGSAVGYNHAGFDIVGVDVAAQPNFPFPFVQYDALEVLRELLAGSCLCPDGEPTRTLYLEDFASIAASPPCQAYTSLASMSNARPHPELIEPTRELLEQTGLPYVIENVPGAKGDLRSPFMLCGTSFGRGVWIAEKVGHAAQWYDLRRHRFFETNWPIGMLPPCAHGERTCGIYGDHFRLGRRSGMGEYSGARAIDLAQKTMGIHWRTTWAELKEAIPPAYTEFIGSQLLAYLTTSSTPPETPVGVGGDQESAALSTDEAA